MFQIPNIALHAPLHLPEFLGLAAVAGDLCPAGDAGFYQMSDHVFVDKGRILLGMLQHMGARAYHGHLPQQYVDELGEFVDAGLSDKVPDFSLARVVGCGLQFVAVHVDTHRTELVAPELFSVLSASLLPEEDGAGGGELDGGTYDEINKREQGAEEAERKDDVERSLQQPVLYLCQGFLADGEDGDIAEHLEVHTAMQVVAHIGYAVKTDQMVFTVVDDRDYFVAACGRQAAIDLLYGMAF